MSGPNDAIDKLLSCVADGIIVGSRSYTIGQREACAEAALEYARACGWLPCDGPVDTRLRPRCRICHGSRDASRHVSMCQACADAVNVAARGPIRQVCEHGDGCDMPRCIRRWLVRCEMAVRHT